jgi:hypothetical protein
MSVDVQQSFAREYGLLACARLRFAAGQAKGSSSRFFAECDAANFFKIAAHIALVSLQ